MTLDVCELFPQLIAELSVMFEPYMTDEEAMRESVKDAHPDVVKRLIDEINLLQNNVSLYWPDVSSIILTGFDSDEEVIEWLEIYKNICKNYLE